MATGSRARWAALLSPRLRRPLLLGIALAVLQQVTGINVFMYFGATIFRNMSASTGVDAGLLQQAVINGACVLFTLIAIAIRGPLGPPAAHAPRHLGMGISLIAMGAMAQFMTDRAATSGWMLLSIVALHRGLRPLGRARGLGDPGGDLSRRRSAAGLSGSPPSSSGPPTTR